MQALLDSEYKVTSFSGPLVGASHASLAHAVSGLGLYDGPESFENHCRYRRRKRIAVPTSRSYSLFECGPAEFNFNFFLSSFCIYAEQAFGKLVVRWIILEQTMKFTWNRSRVIIKEYMKFHKFCVEHNDNERTACM